MVIYTQQTIQPLNNQKKKHLKKLMFFKETLVLHFEQRYSDAYLFLPLGDSERTILDPYLSDEEEKK